MDVFLSKLPRFILYENRVVARQFRRPWLPKGGPPSAWLRSECVLRAARTNVFHSSIAIVGLTSALPSGGKLGLKDQRGVRLLADGVRTTQSCVKEGVHVAVLQTRRGEWAVDERTWRTRRARRCWLPRHYALRRGTSLSCLRSSRWCYSVGVRGALAYLSHEARGEEYSLQ